LNLYNRRTSTILLAVGAVVGLSLGLLLGWVVWPTTFANTTPATLRSDFQDAYVTQVAAQFAATGDVAGAQAKIGAQFWAKDKAVATLEGLAGRLPGTRDAVNLQNLAQALKASEWPPQISTSPTQKYLKPASRVCGGLLVLLALAGVGYFIWYRANNRRPRSTSDRATVSQSVVEPVAWGDDLAPFVQFKTTFTLGDDFYDPSFSIEEASGEFMGECGVGISEAIGVGEPKKVTALEVWIFDKNDIRTVTKVLMSEFAFNDEALHTKLAAKGEMTLAQPGAAVTLETATLVLRGRVVELQYGQGQLPPNSFYQRLGLDLGIWIKPESERSAVPGFVAPPTL
jgi:hypothetical protein